MRKPRAAVTEAAGTEAAGERRLRRDLKLLIQFVAVYCDLRHKDRPAGPVSLVTHDVTALHGRPVRLCEACRRLLAHALVKRTQCPLDPKPACKKCPQHCYAPKYRAQIREVMKVAGRRLVLRGRLDYLPKLFF